MGCFPNKDSLLKGPLDRLEGISQLKFIVSDNLKVFGCFQIANLFEN
jgi:hypothetical protein